MFNKKNLLDKQGQESILVSIKITQSTLITFFPPVSEKSQAFAQTFSAKFNTFVIKSQIVMLNDKTNGICSI